MASTVLYPAIINSTMPAFVVLPDPEENSCRVFFSLSKFNASTDFTSVQVSIKKQSTGENVVNITDDTVNHLYRATGIILDVTPHKVLSEENLYYIDLADGNLKTIDGDYSGWIPGTLYQIQLRLSEVNYQGSELGQAAWLNENANHFSEWSTICILKAISEPYITSQSLIKSTLPFDSRTNSGTYTISSADLYMKYNRTVADKEDLYSYKVTLLSNSNVILEESDVLYTNNYVNNDELKYTIKYDLQDNVNYKIKIEYETRNEYTEIININVLADFDIVAQTTLDIFTVENDNGHLGYSSEYLESEDGRVIVLIYGTESATGAAGNYILRRSSSKDNFSTWEDIDTFTFLGTTVNFEYSDFTIESGIFYKYGIQLIDSQNRRGSLKTTPNPIIREFVYSFILGQNGKQLRLMFNNDMNSFNINLDEGVQKTLGMFPYISRSGAAKYKSFPLNGLISFNMDENNLFLTKEEVYKYQAIIDLYEARESTASYQQYNYTYEKDFREKVLEFLTDGKAKLFKSPTEGNILIRVTNVSCSPNQQLSRMVYSFSATGTQIAETTVEKLNKYKITGKGKVAGSGSATSHASHSPVE